MPQRTIDLFNKGVEANNSDKFRKDNIVYLPADARLIASGDLHGHRRNFERIVNFANLQDNPDNHVLLQEIIHGGPEDSHGGCLSYKLLLDVVKYKLRFPERVHIIMGNHDTAFINNSRVLKNGKEMNRAMQSAINAEFPGSSGEVKLAIKRFLFSQPFAVKCENRIWLSHSLPDDSDLDKFDSEFLFRETKIKDLARPGSAYLLTWGRKHSSETLDKMAGLLDVGIFILGHQPQKQGWHKITENLIIIASDHNHGCLLPFETAKSYTIKQLAAEIVPLASIA